MGATKVHHCIEHGPRLLPRVSALFTSTVLMNGSLIRLTSSALIKFTFARNAKDYNLGLYILLRQVLRR